MTASADPLIFNWAPPRRRARALILFLIASLLLHAACFYIFQIVYPPTVALLPAPARLNLIAPQNPESIAFLRWVEAEDPALATTTQRAATPKALELPSLQHVPSYATYEPKLRPLPVHPPDLSIPSSAAIGAVRVPAVSTAAIVSSVVRKTTAAFADLPEEQSAPVLPEFTFRASRTDAPANARFRVAIDSAGAVRFCFMMESSGDAALDEQARNFLQLCRVPPMHNDGASSGLVWTVTTILWGNDVTTPSANNPGTAQP